MKQTSLLASQRTLIKYGSGFNLELQKSQIDTPSIFNKGSLLVSKLARFTKKEQPLHKTKCGGFCLEFWPNFPNQASLLFAAISYKHIIITHAD